MQKYSRFSRIKLNKFKGLAQFGVLFWKIHLRNQIATVLGVSNDTVKSWLVDPVSPRYRNMSRRYLLTLQTHYELKKLESPTQTKWLLSENIDYCFYHLQIVIDNLESSNFIDTKSEMMSIIYKISSYLHQAKQAISDLNLSPMIEVNTFDTSEAFSLRIQQILNANEYLTKREVYCIIKSILYFTDMNFITVDNLEIFRKFLRIAKAAMDRVCIEIELLYPGEDELHEFVNLVASDVDEIFGFLSVDHPEDPEFHCKVLNESREYLQREHGKFDEYFKNKF